MKRSKIIIFQNGSKIVFELQKSDIHKSRAEKILKSPSSMVNRVV